MNPGELAARLISEHRELDELLGRLLSAAWAEDAVATRAAIEAFDRELRRHTRAEEETVLIPAAGHKLAAPEVENDEERLSRELRLEHVQVRELSGMVIRRLSEAAPLGEVRALAASLARRWDTHTTREEKELLSRSRIENRE